MLYWILAILVLFILVIISMKMEHAHKRFKLIGILIVLAFLYFSITFIVTKTEVQLNNASSWIEATSMYFSWLGNVASGIFDVGKDGVLAVGNVIKESLNH